MEKEEKEEEDEEVEKEDEEEEGTIEMANGAVDRCFFVIVLFVFF